MKIIGIKAKDIRFGVAAEAEVEILGRTVYVSVHDYDVLECTVSAKSVYDFLTGETEEPVEEFLEEYTNWESAYESAFAEVFKILEKVAGLLG